MKTGIVGLGLIGGSMAKAYKTDADNVVFGMDSDGSIVDFAMISEAVDEKLTKENIGECDLVLICVYPGGAIDFLDEYSPYISKTCVVMDCLGTKREICAHGFKKAAEYGYTFAGGHPMAGTHNSGFKYADAQLFKGAPMVIVPPVFDDIQLLDRIKSLFAPVGFGSFSVTTAEEHDRIIAFTSQMAHVVSNAFIKSPEAAVHSGVSAGSFKDLTRVAWLNPEMWTELFLQNRDNLLYELNLFIDNISKYRDAIKNNDADTLTSLLREGCECKLKSQE